MRLLLLMRRPKGKSNNFPIFRLTWQVNINVEQFKDYPDPDSRRNSFTNEGNSLQVWPKCTQLFTFNFVMFIDFLSLITFIQVSHKGKPLWRRKFTTRDAAGKPVAVESNAHNRLTEVSESRVIQTRWLVLRWI